MIGLHLPQRSKDVIQLLCLGAHSDDIEIGCGGTLLHLKQAFPRLKFHWVVLSAGGPRGQEAAKAAELFTAGCEKEILLKDYRDGFFPYNGAQMKDFFEELKSRVNPDLIFTQWSGDAHQDHRLLSELTWNTFRNHLILEYEIPKYDGDMGRPNCFVPLEALLSEQKIDHLFTAFESQRIKKWFDRETFRGLMRLRGMESNSPSGYAEAFYARKVILHPAA
ncbi:MAG TPA: PIG-L deacetylase family protein [Candidatus Dormibacteraeota bacterium]|nr:PIG-L deacetylase family protein [Candidatus Dormibacteraeota bacterium]